MVTSDTCRYGKGNYLKIRAEHRGEVEQVLNVLLKHIPAKLHTVLLRDKTGYLCSVDV